MSMNFIMLKAVLQKDVQNTKMVEMSHYCTKDRGKTLD